MYRGCKVSLLFFVSLKLEIRRIPTLALLKNFIKTCTKLLLLLSSEDLSCCKKLADNESTYYKMVDIMSYVNKY